MVEKNRSIRDERFTAAKKQCDDDCRRADEPTSRKTEYEYAVSKLQTESRFVNYLSFIFVHARQLYLE